MSVSDKGEHGMKLLARHSSNAFAGIPIKKRKFPLVRSPSPPRERPPLSPSPQHERPPLLSDDFGILQSKTSISESESPVSDVGGQVSISENADSFREHKGEPFFDKDEHLASNSDSFPGFDHHQSLASGVKSGMDINNRGVLTQADKSAIGTIVAKFDLWSGPTNLLKPSALDGSGEEKLVQSDTSAFRRVLGNTDLQVTNRGRIYLKQEKLDPCQLNLALAQVQHDTQNRSGDVQSRVDSAHLQADRIHWDLNTPMDMWQHSFSDSSVNNGAGGDDGINLENVHEKGLETSIKMINKEPNEMHAMLQKTDPNGGDWCLRLSNSATVPNECHPSSSCSNLQLNPASGSQSPLNGGVTKPFAKLNLFGEVSDLCLSIKPVIPTTDLKFAAVKSEPCEGGSTKDTTVSDLNGSDQDAKVSNLNLSVTKTVKYEPVEGVVRESPQTVGFGTLNLACRRRSAVKLEPLEFHHKGVKMLEGKTGSHTNMETPISMVMQHDTKPIVFKSSDLVSKSVINDSHNIHQVNDGREIPTNVQIHRVACNTVSRTSSYVSASTVGVSSTSFQHPETSFSVDTTHIASEVPGKAVHQVSDSVAHDVNNFRNDKVVPLSTVLPQDGNQIVCKASDLVSESMITLGKELTPIHKANDMVDNKASILCVESDDKLLSDDTSDIDVQVSCLDGDTSRLPTLTSPDERHLESHGKAEAVIGVEESKVDASHKIREGESQENGNKSEDNNNVAKGHVGGDDYEDGEVRDQLLLGVVEGSSEESEAKHVHREGASDHVDPVYARGTAPSDVDGNESTIPPPDEPKDVVCTVDTVLSQKNDSDLKTVTNAEESTAIRALSTGSGKKKSTKAVRRVLRNHLGKEKALETKPVSKKTIHATVDAVAKDTEGDKGGQLVKAGGSDLLPENPFVLSKVSASINCAVDKHASSSSRSRIIHFNSTLNGSSYGRRKTIPARSIISSQIERGKTNNKSFRGDKPHPWGFRGERRIDGFHKVEKGGNQDQPAGKPGLDYMHARGRVSNQLDALHGVWVPDSKRISEHFSGPKNFQPPRFKNASEVAFAGGRDGLIKSAGRGTRKPPMNDEFKNLPRLPSRRRSPGGRVHVEMQMVHRIMRDASPGRCTEGGVPDFLLNHDEKLARDMADEMVDPSFFHRPNFKYERGENTFIQRERSLSPVQRRGPVHLTLPRPRMRSPRLWSPPQRSSDGFDGHPELIHCRSPPIIRVDQMRSPHQRGCFQEDMLTRRHGSPPYMSRLSDDMRDSDPMRKDDYSNSSRDMQRQIRRFDLIDRPENEEEYFGPFHMGEVHEHVGDECVDGSRNNGERHVLRRPPLRPRYGVGDDDDDDACFHYHVEDGPPRPIRFCAESGEEFPDSGTSRDMNRSIRNRLGNMPRNLRGMEEQIDDLRDDGRQGWHDAGFNGIRLKRRRF